MVLATLPSPPVEPLERWKAHVGEHQLTLLRAKGPTAILDASGGDLGEVFTRRWVVEFILDLAGYTPEKNLPAYVAVEPACGGGAFLIPMVERLIESARLHGRSLKDARTAIEAFDVIPSNVDRARAAVTRVLVEAAVSPQDAGELAVAWVKQGDFLLWSQPSGTADFVLGNPPYIRLEEVPASRSEAYRHACPSMRGRSDVYVGFIERGLNLLRQEGTLGFIVADRWMHNQYGRALRALVASEFSVEARLWWRCTTSMRSSTQSRHIRPSR